MTAAAGKMPSEYRTLELASPEGELFSLAYLDSGAGDPVLFLHEFGMASHTWEALVSRLPGTRRFIRLDIPGFGYSGTPATGDPAPYRQAELISRFIIALNLNRLAVVGNGVGGELALELCKFADIRPRLAGMALLGCGRGGVIPEYIADLGHSATTRQLARLVSSGVVAEVLLKHIMAPGKKVDAANVGRYAEILNLPDRVESIIRAARHYAAPAEIVPPGCPVLLINGEADPLLGAETAAELHRELPGSELHFIHGCGHLVQEEAPQECGKLLLEFFGEAPAAAQPAAAPPAAAPPRQPLKLRRLFDYWRPGVLSLMVILKILQLFRRSGQRAEAHSWRKVTGIFLKKEYSRFVIASMRLRCGDGGGDRAVAEEELARRLQEFIISQPELHWREEPRLWFSRSRRQVVNDVVRVTLDDDGLVTALEPSFDQREQPSRAQVHCVVAAVIEVCNRRGGRRDSRRVREELRRRIRRETRFHPLKQVERLRLAERIMSATFLFFDPLPADRQLRMVRRFSTPDPTRFRHPGWGLLSIVCRMTPDLSEADLWWQFNHVSVDGAPMQEVLSELKRDWGVAGGVVFPPLNGEISVPEITDCGDKLFRMRFFADFTPINELRERLNLGFRDRMNGKASFAGLLMWGISRNEYFHRRKMLLPVDFRAEDGGRRLGLLIMRPSLETAADTLRGFCDFQRAMNRQLEGIRLGHSESGEFMALCAMLHPVFSILTRKLAPEALSEVVGTMGISIIRDAEIFVSPITDFQIDGFMSLGSTAMPTMDGRRAGAVSVCGTREQLDHYYEAISELLRDLPEILPKDTDRTARPDSR